MRRPRADGLFDRIATFDALCAAVSRAALGKRRGPGPAAFMTNLETKVLRLERELRSGTWWPGGYVSFEIRDLKRRRISAASLRDCAAVRGSASRWSSVPARAGGTAPASGTPSTVFACRGRLIDSSGESGRAHPHGPVRGGSMRFGPFCAARPAPPDRSAHPDHRRRRLPTQAGGSTAGENSSRRAVRFGCTGRLYL